MNCFKTSLKLIKENWKSLFLFEILYKAASLLIFTPILVALFDLTLKLSGISYISNDNVFSFIKSPYTILVLIIVAIVATMIVLIEISAIIQCIHASYFHKKISVIDMCYSGLFAALKLLRRNNILMIVFVLLIIPITNIALVSGYLSSWKVPDFIFAYIKKNNVLEVGFYLAMLLLTLLTVKWIFSIHSFTIHSTNFKEAHIESAKLTKGNYFRNIALILSWTLFIVLTLAVAIFAGTGIIAIFGNLLHQLRLTYGIMFGAIGVYMAILLFVYATFSIPITITFVSSLYYENLERLGMEISPYVPQKRTRSRFPQYVYTVIFVLLAANLVYAVISPELAGWKAISKLQPPTITAHRGDSAVAPENTLPAFQSAVDNLADIIELDVGQTKDGVLVVFHDSNLKRITGVDKNIWDVTYSELEELDAGCWFSTDYCGTKICTLQEALDFAKGEVELNIELKPTGHEIDFEKSVVDLIVENGFEDECVLASMNFNTVKTIKDYNPYIKVAYITTVAYGNLLKLKNVDVFSVEASFITKSMVSKVHGAGKEMYAWTVNSEESMKKMVSLGVDSIITDDPVAAREMIYSNSINKRLLKYIEFLSGYRNDSAREA